MNLHGDLAQTNFRSDLLVHQAGAHQAHDLPLSIAECLVSRPQGLRLFLELVTCSIALQRNADSIQKILLTKRLGQALDRSSLHGLHGHRNVAVPRNENYWNVNLSLGQLGLKIEPAQARQSDIQY